MTYSRLRTLLLGWEVVYWGFLVIIFAVAIRLRIQLPAIPFLDPDSWDYLQPAITSLTGGSGTTYREFLYPWLLEHILRLWPSFKTIIVLQHSAGISAAGLLLMAWHRMRVFLPNGVTVDALHRVGGWTLTALYLFAMISLLNEHKIRPEAFFILIVALCIWLATEFSRDVFRSRNFGLRAGLFGVLLIFFPAVAYYLRPYYGFGVLSTFLPVFVALVWTPNSWWTKFGTLIVGTALVFGFLVWPDRQFHNKQRTGNEYFLAEGLFCSSAETVYDLLQEDARVLPDDPRRSTVEVILASMNRLAIHSSKIYAGFIHFNPDDVRYRGPAEVLKKSLNWDDRQIKRFYYSYYFRAWRQYPLRMIKKITAQLWDFYSPHRKRIYDRKEFLDVSLELQRSKQILLEHRIKEWAPFQEYTRQVLALQGPNQLVNMPKFIRVLGNLMNPIYFVSLLLTLLVAIALSLGWLREEGRIFKTTSLWALYLFSYNFGMSFTIAFVHVIAQRRYTYGQTLFSALSQCFALIFLLSLATTLLSIRRQR